MPDHTAPSDDIAGRVVRIVADTKRLPLASVTPESTLEDLQIDSLDRLNILFDLEKEFGIEINDDEARRVRTVGDMIGGVTQLVTAQGA